MRIRTLAQTIVAGLLLSVSAQAQTVTVMGSTALGPIVKKAAEDFMKANAGVQIAVSGGGSMTGLNQVTSGGCVIGISDVYATPDQDKAGLVNHNIVVQPFTLIAHPGVGVTTLTAQQAEQVFTGKVNNWKEVGGPDAPITVYSRENSSGTYEFFKANVLMGKDFVSSAQTMPGTAAIVQAVVKDKNGIGYGGAAYGGSSKLLAIKKTDVSPAILPTEENVISGTYPIWRHLYVYVNPNLDKGEVAAYLTWIRSDDGQKYVKDIGYYPLPKNLRSN